MDMFLSGLRTVLESCGSLIIVVVGAFVVYGLRLLCKKIGIDLKDTDYNAIIAIVKQVIKYLDQKYVDTIKKNSPDNTLTEQQQSLIKNQAGELVKKLLSSEQIQLLLSKYNLSEIDDVIDILIESNLAEARNETDNNNVVINEELIKTLDEESSDEEKVSAGCVQLSEFEMQSLAHCGANCNKCGLHCEWCRCSYCSECRN